MTQTIVRKLVYWPGDIIILGRKDDQLYSHRFLGYLLGRRGLKAITIADSEKIPDAPATTKRILGKAVRIDGQTLVCNPQRRIQAIITFFRVLPGIIRTSLTATK